MKQVVIRFSPKTQVEEIWMVDLISANYQLGSVNNFELLIYDLKPNDYTIHMSMFISSGLYVLS